MLYLHVAVHLALGILQLEGFALVVLLLTPGQGDIDLGQPAVVNKEAEGDNGKPLLLRLALQLVELLALQQQLAVALGVVVVVRSPPVLGDVHAAHEQLAAVEVAVGIHQAGLAGAYRLDLGARQHDSGRVGLEELVVVARPLVA